MNWISTFTKERFIYYKMIGPMSPRIYKLLVTRKLSGIVARELSSLWLSPERRSHETNRIATGGQEDAF